MKPAEFADTLKEIYGDNLKSVILYGSAVGNDHTKKYSDFNIFCILSDPSPIQLAKSTKAIKKWVKKGNPPPHFFDPSHIETSLDVFPLEFMDIRDRHEVLVGDDPLRGITIDAKNLRHQCESELKGKLLHLRAFYALNSNNQKRVMDMTIRTFSTFLAAFKGIIRLTGKTPSNNSKETIEGLAKIIDINPQVFMDIINIRTGEDVLPRGDDAIEMFERYLTEITTVTNYVDKMNV